MGPIKNSPPLSRSNDREHKHRQLEFSSDIILPGNRKISHVKNLSCNINCFNTGSRQNLIDLVAVSLQMKDIFRHPYSENSIVMIQAPFSLQSMNTSQGTIIFIRVSIKYTSYTLMHNCHGTPKHTVYMNNKTLAGHTTQI